jgi:GGDEF domain-containing protein
MMPVSSDFSAHFEFLLDVLTRHHGLGLVLLDENLNIRQINDRAADLLGFPGRSVGMLITDVVDELFGMEQALKEVILQRQKFFSLELIEKENPNGKPYYISLSFYLYPYQDEPPGLLLVCEQVRLGHLIQMLNQQYVETRLYRNEHQSDLSIDPLTGLENRKSLEYKISSEAIAALQSSRDLIVLVIDIEQDATDHTQAVNSRDSLLRVYARALKSVFSQGGSVYRLSDNQFVVVSSTLTRQDFDFLRQQVQMVTERVRRKGFVDFHAVAEIAAISETNYDPREAIQLADLRIFALKRSS